MARDIKSPMDFLPDLHLPHGYIYETILNSIEEGIQAVDAHGNIILYNPAMELLEGQKASEVLGKHVTSVYNISLMFQVITEKKPILNRYISYTTRNGRTFDILASAVPLFHDDELIGAVAIIRDYTKFREMAEKNIELQKNHITNKPNLANNTSNNNKVFPFEKLIGNNPELLKTITWAKEAAKTSSPVFIYGETGTGKELIAQSIHEYGPNCAMPFLAINCAAIPETLLESFLFGTVKGAFTGAVDRCGLFEQANGGTIFLDEINSMPIALQSKLLRVLEEKKVRRLGSNKDSPINVRIISCSNTEPNQAIDDRLIRADLFYRLSAVYLSLPPLRKRLDDIELLSDHFIAEINRKLGKNIKGLSQEVLLAFKNNKWPGNIRQLKNVIESAISICPENETLITLKHIPGYLNIDFSADAVTGEVETDSHIDIRKLIKNQEREEVISALTQAKGNLTKAAEQLGMSRQSLVYRLKKYKLV